MPGHPILGGVVRAVAVRPFKDLEQRPGLRLAVVEQLLQGVLDGTIGIGGEDDPPPCLGQIIRIDVADRAEVRLLVEVALLAGLLVGRRILALPGQFCQVGLDNAGQGLTRGGVDPVWNRLLIFFGHVISPKAGLPAR